MLGDTAIAVHPEDPRYKVTNIFTFDPIQHLLPTRSIYTANLLNTPSLTGLSRSLLTTLLSIWNLELARSRLLRLTIRMIMTLE